MGLKINFADIVRFSASLVLKSNAQQFFADVWQQNEHSVFLTRSICDFHPTTSRITSILEAFGEAACEFGSEHAFVTGIFDRSVNLGASWYSGGYFLRLKWHTFARVSICTDPTGYHLPKKSQATPINMPHNLTV